MININQYLIKNFNQYVTQLLEIFHLPLAYELEE